jgi:hypothetical protein
VIGTMDFTASAAVLSALLAALLFPAVLAGLARVPALRDRNALQFLVSSIIVIGAWMIALLVPSGSGLTAADVATAGMILAGALLIYLEAWALLSRGYTLSLLLTLFHADHPMTDAELAARYRRGQGLGWIMRHRLGGLLSARLVRRRGDLIVLTTIGAVIGRLYRAAIATLGLKVTG